MKSSNVLQFPPQEPQAADAEDPGPRHGDGDGEGPLVIRIVLELGDGLDAQPEEPAPKERRWPAFLFGAVLGWWAGG